MAEYFKHAFLKTLKPTVARPDVMCAPALKRLWLRLFIFALAGVAPTSLVAQTSATIAEEVEWTWEVRPPHPDPKLPNVLLLGDSISRNYFPEVQTNLQGKANVYLMASSTSVGDPRLGRQIREFAVMEKVRFRVVHFNNGMHGWAYTETQYKAAFPAFLRSVHSLTEKGGTLVWANTTPVRPDAKGGATNARVEDRNGIAHRLVEAAGISIDDQFALMDKHPDLHEDAIHFNAEGAKIQGEQAAKIIRMALGSQ